MRDFIVEIAPAAQSDPLLTLSVNLRKSEIVALSREFQTKAAGVIEDLNNLPQIRQLLRGVMRAVYMEEHG